MQKEGGTVKEKLIISINDLYIYNKVQALRMAGIDITEIVNGFLEQYEIPKDEDIA